MTCPICAKPADPAYRPFCSRRCADIDLGRWFNESYAIPAPEAEEDGNDTTCAHEPPQRAPLPH